MVSVFTIWSVALRPRVSVFITCCGKQGRAPPLSLDAQARVQQEVNVDLPRSTLAAKSYRNQIRVMTRGLKLRSVIIN